MKLNIDSKILHDSISKILSVVDKKNTNTIISQIKFHTNEQGLELSATDMEISAKAIISCNVEKPGSFCVNAKNIFEIVKELPESEINFEEVNNSLLISSGNINYTLLVSSSDEFPSIVTSSEGLNFSINNTKLGNIINKTIHSISTDETRLYLNGIFMQEIDSKLRTVSTDGHRLSLVDTNMDIGNNEVLVNGIIIPKKGVYELKKLSDFSDEKDINFCIDESFLYANIEGEFYLSIRLIARDYPKYQAVIPNKTLYNLKADKEELYNAIKRIKIMANEKSNGVKVKLNENNMTIVANHPSLGNASEKINVDYDGKEMEIGFNAKYLIDALANFDGGDVNFELNNELSPVILKSHQQPDYLGIIMPLKL